MNGTWEVRPDPVEGGTFAIREQFEYETGEFASRWIARELNLTNARLIAAAPHMLAALKAIQSQLECPARNTNRGRNFKEGVVISSDVGEMVSTAIIKAESKS